MLKKYQMILISLPLRVLVLLWCIERQIQDYSFHCRQLNSDEINKKTKINIVIGYVHNSISFQFFALVIIY